MAGYSGYYRGQPVENYGPMTNRIDQTVCSPIPSQDYKHRLARLECHFRWRPEGGSKLKDLEAIMARLELYMEEEPYARKPTLALLGYLHLRAGNHIKAIAALDKADSAAADPLAHHITCSFVVRANRLHVLYDQGKEDLTALRQLEKSWREKSGGPRLESEVWGVKAMSLTWFTRDAYREAIACFGKARVLDEKNPHWLYGESLVRRRLRDGGSRSQTEIESLVTAEKCLAKATEITGNSNALYLAEHALCLAEYHHTYTLQSGQQEESLVHRATAEADTARAGARGRQEVYRLCAAAYKRLGLYHLQRESLEMGVSHCEINYDLLHALGAFYANSRSREDQERAIQLLGLALDKCPHPGHARASLDFLRLKAILDTNSRLGGELLALEEKFPLANMDKQYRRDFADLRTLCMRRLKQPDPQGLRF